MKKWFFLLLLSPKLFALYMGNPSAPEIVDEGFFFCKENWFAVKAGYQRDWVFDRNMKAVSKISGRMDDFDFISDQGVLTINLIDRIELYGSAGAARFHAIHRPRAGVRHEYETHDQFTWGLGARGAFATWKGASFGVDAVYQRAHPTMKWMTVNGAPVTPRPGSKLTYYEWQVGFGASYQIDLFIPYIGAKYSNAGARFKNLPSGFLPSGRYFKTKNRRKFGMVVGTTLSNGNRFAATVEARLIDEQSITLAAEVKF
ncbi:MAG: hypothetical protein KFB93_01350 [Simkaniaceae bacterium]|nr:MAG: hypothetical protein KFB93_01350 [Simkaniaceae bacterium]